MNSGRFGWFVAAGIILVIAGLSLFTVNEREQAIKRRLGEVVASTYEPGLHWKIPLVEDVRKFSRQILTISDRPERVFTAENESLDVDYFVKYRITDPVRYYTSSGGDREIAEMRLGEIVKNAIVTEFGKRTVAEAISVGRAELMRDLLDRAEGTAEDLGVDLVDFRVKQVEFMEEVRNSVYAQMEAERQRIAAERRAEGRENEAEIRASADRERTIILAEAYRDSEKIRGEGDARAAETYANAYNKDPEFYAFYRSIDAYKRSVGQPGDILVVDPDNEFFRYLNQSDGRRD
ncbi:MAG TPA: protease modulator HflC [Woeseiaceae bacterium]|nr:protease modulator HflC [Woeseiaceae bacterium]